MPKENISPSALFIRKGDGDTSVLVVGGRGSSGNEAALLFSCPQHMREAQGGQNSTWRWRQISPMLEERPNRPGLLLLGGDRVLVCGGCSGLGLEG